MNDVICGLPTIGFGVITIILFWYWIWKKWNHVKSGFGYDVGPNGKPASPSGKYIILAIVITLVAMYAFVYIVSHVSK